MCFLYVSYEPSIENNAAVVQENNCCCLGKQLLHCFLQINCPKSFTRHMHSHCSKRNLCTMPTDFKTYFLQLIWQTQKPKFTQYYRTHNFCLLILCEAGLTMQIIQYSVPVIKAFSTRYTMRSSPNVASSTLITLLSTNPHHTHTTAIVLITL